jgi:hypothetical protein
LDKFLGQTVFFEEKVDLVRTRDHGSGREEWLAPDLACKEVRWQAMTLQPDGSQEIGAEGNPVNSNLGNRTKDSSTLGSAIPRSSPPNCCAAKWKRQAWRGITTFPEMLRVNTEYLAKLVS